MVKIELGPNVQKPQRTRITTKHLPPELMAEGDWQHYFVPALLSWLGSQEEVWSNDDSAIAESFTLRQWISTDHNGHKVCWSCPGRYSPSPLYVPQFHTHTLSFYRPCNESVNGGTLLAQQPSGLSITGLMTSLNTVNPTLTEPNGQPLRSMIPDSFIEIPLRVIWYVHLYHLNTY